MCRHGANRPRVIDLSATEDELKPLLLACHDRWPLDAVRFDDGDLVMIDGAGEGQRPVIFQRKRAGRRAGRKPGRGRASF